MLSAAGLAVLVATGLLPAGQASAASEVASADPAQSVRVLQAVQSTLGDRVAGAYLDSSNRPMVAVTDTATEKAVVAAGAVPTRVKHSMATLTSATDTLTARATIPGTSWAIDPVANQVVVSYDTTVSGARLDQLKATVALLGDAARLEALSGTLGTTISGGDAIYGSGGRCSLGFNVKVGGADYFLTAGHCGNVISSWYTSSGQSTKLGNTVRSTFPGSDYALVQYTNTSITKSGAVGSQDITSAGTTAVGQTVYRRGSTTGVHSGRVTALNATVNYAEGSVRGTIRTTVCAEPGDSGGPLYSGTTALGLTSGGSGNCSSGGVTFFQPVGPALSAYGASVF